jgi:hypothetical protein
MACVRDEDPQFEQGRGNPEDRNALGHRQKKFPPKRYHLYLSDVNAEGARCGILPFISSTALLLDTEGKQTSDGSPASLNALVLLGEVRVANGLAAVAGSRSRGGHSE